MEYEFYQVGYKRFKAENEEGNGKLMMLDDKTSRCKASDLSQKATKIRELYRLLKRELA
jgi:hypothetical protein